MSDKPMREANVASRRAEKRMREHVAALGSEDDAVAERAEQTLIRYYGARPVELLLDACDSPNPNVRFRAAWILGKSRHRHATDTLLRLTADPSDEVRYDAVLALGHGGDPRAIEPLICLLRTPDEEGALDSAAAGALALIGAPAVPALAALLQTTRDVDLQIRIAYALRIPNCDAAVDALATLLAHKEASVREVALEQMGLIESDYARSLLAGLTG